MGEPKTTKAQQRATQKYVSANYDRVVLTMPKGYREQVRAAAQRQGESLNGFINRLLREAVPPQDVTE